jgi:hypothetical protein
MYTPVLFVLCLFVSGSTYYMLEECLLLSDTVSLCSALAVRVELVKLCSSDLMYLQVSFFILSKY